MVYGRIDRHEIVTSDVGFLMVLIINLFCQFLTFLLFLRSKQTALIVYLDAKLSIQMVIYLEL